ncbi:erythromycin esterase family protein [Paenibacillus azoreducens]|uniref:Hydrolase YbfO n=1 Tax=Paenibacillus azoreducens TaxID=116718 RepID=A0A919YI83_9BACL|nr:erythromycin esterase family protein [Paenibacillus azoreducens]GIO50078.1 putative hydrolase YbfO [Paenibacillus azoreducens]
MKPTFAKIMKFSTICAIVTSIGITSGTVSAAPAAKPVPVKSNPIQTIEFKTNDKFEDLRFLKNVIGNKKIVMIGESSHGAAEFNKSKARLVQFLHKEMGFNVLAFESGLGDTSGTYANISKLTGEETLRKSIYPVWHAKELVPMFDYIKQQSTSKQPLILTGFDMQPNPDFGRFMETWFAPIDKQFAVEAKNLEKKLTNIYYNVDWNQADWDQDYTYVLDGYTKIQKFMAENEAALQKDFPNNKTIMPIMKHVIADRIYMIQNMLKYQVAYNNLTPENYVVSKSLRENVAYLRDEMMASTLTWLVDNIYKDQKVIVWGHNYHVRKNNSVMDSPVQLHLYEGGSVQNMGELMPSRLKQKTYTIGLFMYEGATAGNDGKAMPVSTTKDPDSVESILKSTGKSYAFVDLTSPYNKEWKNSTHNGMYWGMIEEPFVPSQQYDGILFIKKTTPSVYLK